MRNRNPEMVEVIWDGDKLDHKFRCKVCGHEWWRCPSRKKYSWQCPKGCQEENLGNEGVNKD